MTTVIKAGQPTKLLRRLSAVDLADHLLQARQMVEEAERHAADIGARAAAEASRARALARNEAHEAGYREGYNKGHSEGREVGSATGHQEAFDRESARLQVEQTHLIADMQRAVGEIDAMKNALCADAEQHVLDFTIKLATRLTYAIGSLHPAAAQANLARALQFVYERTNLTARLHPEDLRALEQLAPAAAGQLESARNVQFMADETIARGGCFVRAERTEVDATLETQLSEIVSILLGGHAAPAEAAP